MDAARGFSGAIATAGGGSSCSTTATGVGAWDMSEAQHGTRLTAGASGAWASSCSQQQHDSACIVGHARPVAAGSTNAIVTSTPSRRAHHRLAHVDLVPPALIPPTVGRDAPARERELSFRQRDFE